MRFDLQAIEETDLQFNTLRQYALCCWFVSSLLLASTAGAEPWVLLPEYRLSPEELGVIVNVRDPLSHQITDYYMARRGIPRANRIRVDLPTGRATLSAEAFESVYAEIQDQTPPQVKAYALTWTRPYRVGCMSIGTAIAAGFDRAWCSAETCAKTRLSPLIADAKDAPETPGAFRPTMVLAATDFGAARALIERGISADDRWPQGTAYLLKTGDKARSVRSVWFDETVEKLGERVDIEVLEADELRDRSDVLFYFTGKTWVDGLDTLGFLPGAVADHLTSAGGKLPAAGDSPGILDRALPRGQMSAIEWLRAGATGSYGTVVEPCNLLGKFPHPGVVMERYLSGATLIEAYWHSVAMPGEGIFVGEPLASPFGGYRLARGDDGRWVLETGALRPGRYRIETAPSPVGPFVERKASILNWRGRRRYPLPSGDYAAVRLVRVP